RMSYERLATWYEERTLAGERLYLSCFDERIRTRTHGPLAEEERCQMGRRQFSIAPSGRLYPCIQFVREDDDPTYALGDVLQGFDSDRRRAVSGCADGEKAECGGCALRARCSSWCACINFLSTGRIDQASPVLCEHERLLMPIADGVANRLWKQRDPLFLHKHYNPAFPVLEYAERLTLREVSR
ncbi:MAG: SPASM domain-containing protein, partial [Chthoniobacterales bacterium]|nr:SPASM domain-containing protein [Chthoniobacterales bacterium]